MARLFDPHRACSALSALPPRGPATREPDAAEPHALEQAFARSARLLDALGDGASADDPSTDGQGQGGAS